MKLCRKCGIDKPLEAFHRQARGKDGRHNWCKECAKAYRKQYYSDNAESLKAATRSYYADNREERLAYAKRYQADNRDRLREYLRQYCADNAAKARERASDWQRSNPERMRLNGSRRRSRERAAFVVHFSAEQLALRWAYYGNCCYLCGVSADQTDHVKPLAKGGAHMLSNLRPICRSCNSSKSDKWPFAPLGLSEVSGLV